MKEISINGKKLHKVMLPLEPYEKCNSVSSLCYPKSRILFEQFDDGLLKLTIPANLALEMYRVGILPQDLNISFPVCLSGKPVGNYKVVNFLYPNNSIRGNIVYISLLRQ